MADADDDLPWGETPRDVANLSKHGALVLAAAQATSAASDLLERALIDEPPDLDTVYLLVDASIILIEASDDLPRDGQLLGALHKWKIENYG